MKTLVFHICIGDVRNSLIGRHCVQCRWALVRTNQGASGERESATNNIATYAIFVAVLKSTVDSQNWTVTES